MELKTMWALLLLALLPLSSAQNTTKKHYVTVFNERRTELATRLKVSNMARLSYSERLVKVLESMSCDNYDHGATYRAFPSARQKEGLDYKTVLLKTSMFPEGAMVVGINALNKFKRPTVNFVEMFHPQQTEVGCREMQCDAENDGVRYHFWLFCLFGPHGGPVFNHSSIQIEGQDLKLFDVSDKLDGINKDRKALAEKFQISNMNKVRWANEFVVESKKFATKCEGMPEMAGGRAVVLPAKNVKTSFDEYLKTPDTTEEFLELVDKMAALPSQVPNKIDFYNPQYKYVGCINTNCTKWTVGSETFEVDPLVCLFGGEVGKTTRDLFKVPPPPPTPEAPPAPTEAPPSDPMPQKQKPIGKGKNGEEEEDRMFEDDEDLEDSAPQLSVLILVAFVASVLF